jgi:hypothetical protein
MNNPPKRRLTGTSFNRTVPLRWTDVLGRTCDALVTVNLVENRTAYSVSVVLVRDGKADRSSTKKLLRSRDGIATYVGTRLKVFARRIKREFDRESGAVLHESTDKDTGRLRQIAFADDRDSGNYEVICAEHGTLVGVETLGDARRTSLVDFCDECRDALAKDEPR